MILRIAIIFLGAGLLAAQAGDSSSRTTIGMDPGLNEGAVALRLGDFEAGVRLILGGLESTLTLRDRANALSNLCAGYVGAEQFVKALESCDRALELSARNWRIYNNRALALLGLGRIAAAREDVEKGLALNPDSVTLARVAGLIDKQFRGRVVTANRMVIRH